MDAECSALLKEYEDSGDPDGHTFCLLECAKTHLQQSTISKIFRGVTLGPRSEESAALRAAAKGAGFGRGRLGGEV